MNLGISELVIIFSIIVLLVFLAAMVSRVGLKISHRMKTPAVTPLEILKARYARGEINKEQFEQIKKDLA